ncbi:hypothetical protein Agabi119p4_279 [Agaricus bisporus var. burnettii]|uniref:Nucleoporin Pom152 n=1 Tax=Agaricus bisporus var. burnettii TaxID=192524 RepID=A0A8H7FAG6_AGABI|nr:hypothetical protein Agabi119p4_279 [Agaricus bisporus var. burnettii]
MATQASTQAVTHPKAGPLIPERYLDVPSQRLYYFSVAALCQGIKMFEFLWPLNWNENRLALCRKWIFVDFLLVTALSLLRIPRLNYNKTTIALSISFIWFIDGLMFGGISLNVGSQLSKSSSAPHVGSSGTYEVSKPQQFSFLDVIAPFSLGLIKNPYLGRDQHLLGQHTVRMSPISTAQLNPDANTYCLTHSPGYVLLPILLNNTNVAGLKYSISPLNAPMEKAFIDVTAKHLEQTRQEHLRLTTTASPPPTTDYEDEYDEDDDDDPMMDQSKLQKSQSLVYLRISRPGVIQLEAVWDGVHNEARLVQPSAVAVVSCPSVTFVDAAGRDDAIRCAGQDNSMDLMISVNGVPPLSLRWLKTINGKRDQYLVEGIEDAHHSDSFVESSGGSQNAMKPNFVSQSIKIPLSISLNEPGTHLYALEEIVDGQGNVMRVGSQEASNEGGVASKTETTKSFLVLRQPLISFRNCNTQHPKPLLIGSETELAMAMQAADIFDAPWEISLQYQPPRESLDGSKADPRLKPWGKRLKIQDNEDEYTLRASTPGEYTITGIKGKHCVGEVLAPDTCSVVERPLPSAQIEWKRIHECSGDIGVSASLILHGTPPFQVHYKMQRDNAPAEERSKFFSSSRGELTLQPEKSGHYKFAFVAMSDANYRKVELRGPSIDQIVHPLASADFAESATGKKAVSSCAGDTVDVDVDLRGTGPWNIEFQIIGPNEPETFRVSDIDTPKKRIQIPIPEELRKNGGQFEINLLSAEDSYCKRLVSVPGMVVSVKRTWPTAQFYGKTKLRRVTITEGEHANLPLRLSGDGPWRLRYRLKGDKERTLSATLHSPNDNLRVADKGTYELIGIGDSLCPGNIISDAATYEVDWIPRPSAQLSPSIVAIHDPHNGSYILSPICEGVSGHVDLDLTGRPPFQIMYNIAQDNEMGGTKLIGQPTFNSIQPHTRFQLQTSAHGRMYYEVKQIGDTAYPLVKHKAAVIPRSDRLLFEQQVMRRPSVRFQNRNRMTYCQNEAFTPLDPASSDGILLFEGTPPFTLTLSVKDIAASHVETQTIDVYDFIWKLSLPSYQFKSIGSYLVTLESITDSSNCVQSALDPMFGSVWIDVAETAAIIPFERRQDICVGDTVQFQLEGIPPWTVGYRTNNKAHSQEVKTSPFSLLQSHPGELAITSIAHQQKTCKASVTDLRYNVHPLPSAQVGHGKRIIQDIHEGDQAEIIFTLVGEPPFTFTYQRSELSPKKGGKPGKVLETHTVSRVMTREYSIFSALEGTWTVTSIADRYCRYPPLQTELDDKSHQ